MKTTTRFKKGNEIYRQAIPEVGDPLEMDFDEQPWEEEDAVVPEPEDAYMKPSGPLGSQINLSVEHSHLGTFNSQEEAEAFLAQWAEENNYWPNLWFIDDHGGGHGPVEYGVNSEGDAGPGRQEGATYRQSTIQTPWYVLVDDEYHEFYGFGKTCEDAVEQAVHFYRNNPEYTPMDREEIEDLSCYPATQAFYDERGSDFVIDHGIAMVADESDSYLEALEAGEFDPPLRFGSSKQTSQSKTAAPPWMLDDEDDLPGEEYDLPDEEYDLPDEEDGLPDEEEYLPNEEEYLPEDDLSVEENFPLDVSIIDTNVIELIQSDPDLDDLSVVVDYDSVLPENGAALDLDKLQATLNDASLVTSVGGHYYLEKEGDEFTITFEADPEATEELIQTFWYDHQRGDS